jgi:hypothetical protein
MGLQPRMMLVTRLVAAADKRRKSHLDNMVLQSASFHKMMMVWRNPYEVLFNSIETSSLFLLLPWLQLAIKNTEGDPHGAL